MLFGQVTGESLLRSHSTQESNDLVAYFGGSFVLHPMANVVEFDETGQTGKSSAEVLLRRHVQFIEAIFSANESYPCKRNLRR